MTVTMEARWSQAVGKKNNWIILTMNIPFETGCSDILLKMPILLRSISFSANGYGIIFIVHEICRSRFVLKPSAYFDLLPAWPTKLRETSFHKQKHFPLRTEVFLGGYRISSNGGEIMDAILQIKFILRPNCFRFVSFHISVELIWSELCSSDFNL